MGCELIYMFFNRIDSLPYLRNQGICLSNKYDISVDMDEFDYCTSIIMEEKEDIYENIYSEHVKSINALVGINGIGKTTLFNILGSNRNERKGKLYQWTFFFIYQIDDYFVIEGNDKELIKEAVDNFEHPHGISPEYSVKCRYDFVNKRFVFFELCHEEKQESAVNKVLYYKDRSDEAIGWSNKYDRQDGMPDYNVFAERQVITATPMSICNYIHSIQNGHNWGKFNLPQIGVRCSLEGRRRTLFWKGYGREFEKKTFILHFLLDYAAVNSNDLSNTCISELQAITEMLDKKSTQRNLEYADIDDYLEMLRKKYSLEKCLDLLEVVELLYKLEDKYFLLNPNSQNYSELFQRGLNQILKLTPRYTFLYLVPHFHP